MISHNEISHGSNCFKFNNVNPVLYQEFLRRLSVDPIVLTLTSTFLPKVSHYVTSTSKEDGDIVLLTEATISSEYTDLGLMVGDPMIIEKDFRSYQTAFLDHKKARMGAFASVIALFDPSSYNDLLAKKFYSTYDYFGLMMALKESNMAMTISNGMDIAKRYVEILRGSTPVQSLVMSSELSKLWGEFLGIHNLLTTSSETVDDLKQWKHIHELWSFYIKYILLAILATPNESSQILQFIQTYLRASPDGPFEIRFKKIDDLYESFINSARTISVPAPLPAARPHSQVMTVDIDGTRVSMGKRKMKAFVALMNGNPGGGSKPPPFKKTKTTHVDKRLCAWCKKPGHLVDFCFNNPNRTNADKPLPKGFVMQPKSHFESTSSTIPSVNTVFTESFGSSAFELNSMTGGKIIYTPTPSIILDGGSTDNVFNSHYRYLFLDYQHIDPICISGIGGGTGLNIIGFGKIIFMGKTIEAFYCPNTIKSVVSEGLLCSQYNFLINKIGNIAIIKNIDTSLEIIRPLSSNAVQYELKLEDFSCSLTNKNNKAEIFLASVRPSNPKTLWHGRFCHYNMKTIVKMARNPIYMERGLRLPDHLLKTDHDEDLCDSCAKGKPTISFSHIRHVRAKIKGKLWYIDVSGGGNRVPSLVDGNIYLYLFVDSFSRKYFPYYSKYKNEANTKRIIQIHQDSVLSLLDLSEEIIYFQSDNGELDTTGIKAWCTRNRIINRFTNPYHPSMNGFVERAFRTIFDLSISVMVHAGLPDPYWERSSRFACLICDIMPNQTIDGYAREAYFLWTGLMFDYSKLRTWGSRAYAINHLENNDFIGKSEEGIFVGFKNCLVTLDYEIYLPHKNKFITSGDVLFCEHVGRREPERLLPPVLQLPPNSREYTPENYQNLVGTIHLDNQEGVQYKVLKVYKSKGLVIVDRSLYDAKDPNRINLIDTVHLLDVIGYPILQGAPNPVYNGDPLQFSRSDSQPVGSSNRIENNNEDLFFPTPLTGLESSSPGNSSQFLTSDERTLPHQLLLEDLQSKDESVSTVDKTRGKRNRSELQDINNKSSIKRYSSRLLKQTSDKAITDEDWQVTVANLCIDWSLNMDQPLIFSTIIVEDITQPDSYKEPRHHKEAISLPEAEHWLASEGREISSLNKNKFAEIVLIPTGRKILNCRWVYAFKKDHTGKVVLYKSRIVVRGDQAVEGVDYFETFSPVAKLETIRLALALIVILKMKPLQMDVNTAYLHSDLEEDIYMWGFPGYPLKPGYCWKLLKSLYGLPQAGRNWNKMFVDFLLTLEFIQIREDLCLFILVRGGEIVAIFALYVDDFIVGTTSDDIEIWLVSEISKNFDIKVIGLPSLLVGITLNWTPMMDGARFYSKVHLSISKSINSLLRLCQMTTANTKSIPANPSAVLSKTQCPSIEERLDGEILNMQKWYRVIVGTFIWINTTVRIDISHIVLILCSFMSNPAWEHYNAALWLLQYLKGSINRGIEYSVDNSPDLIGYVDSDHQSHEDRYSVYHYMFLIAGGPLSWKSGFSDRISLSTAESEIRGVHAMKQAIKHSIYLKKVFVSLHLSDFARNSVLKLSSLPIVIREDNRACIRFSLNPAGHSKMKHLESDIYWILDAVHKFKDIVLEECLTENMLADPGTKNLTTEEFLSKVLRFMVDGIYR